MLFLIVLSALLSKYLRRTVNLTCIYITFSSWIHSFFFFSHFLIFFNHNTTKSFAALKAEPFHDSALARFLLRRSIANPARVGHCFYWALAADCHIKGCAHRFELLKNTYLR